MITKEEILKMSIHTKLPKSSNKDIPEKNQVREEWRNLDHETRRFYPRHNGSLFVERQVQVSPFGSQLKLKETVEE